MAAVQFFGEKLKQLVMDLVDVQMVLGLVPKENKRVVVVHIDKPGGGSRPLSLFEEMTKTVEGVLAKRMDAACARVKLGGVLSSSNHAYQLGRGTLQPLAVDALVREEAVEKKKSVVRLQ